MMTFRPAPGSLSVLCLGAHPDDIEIGCGGLLLTLAHRPVTTVSAVVLSGTPERRAEAEAALPSFVPGASVQVLDLPDGRMPGRWEDVKLALQELASVHSPDLILAPRVDDAHQDHRLLGQLAATSWRSAVVLHYEIPKWDADLTPPTHYVPLSEEQARRKVALLHRGYPSQHGRDWWDEELFLGVMRLRGVECRSRYAEAFHSHKVLLDLGPDES